MTCTKTLLVATAAAALVACGERRYESDDEMGRDRGRAADTARQNDDPEARDDEANATAGAKVTLDVLRNDRDPDRDLLTVREVAQPDNGVVRIGADGRLEYTPNAGFEGVDEFEYTVEDGRGGTSSATVTIRVGAQSGTEAESEIEAETELEER